jgi:hypothetical protein
MFSEIGKSNRVHGETSGPFRSREYIAWNSMIGRCYNPNNIGYPKYGKAGVNVCARWKESFENFLADMGRKPTREHTLDRINSSGNYEPGNCRWATQIEQQRNRRSCVYVEIDGVKKCVTEWAETPGAVSVTAFRRRVKGGWDPKRALYEPILLGRRPVMAGVGL